MKLLKGDSFFEKWVRHCMLFPCKIKNPQDMIDLCDNNIVDELLLAFSKPDCPVKNK